MNPGTKGQGTEEVEQVPDATTLLRFRHLIEKNHLGESFREYSVCRRAAGNFMEWV